MDCLFIYIKFNAMDHSHQHVPFDAKNGSFVHVAYCVINDNFKLLPQNIKFIDYPLYVVQGVPKKILFGNHFIVVGRVLLYLWEFK